MGVMGVTILDGRWIESVGEEAELIIEEALMDFVEFVHEEKLQLVRKYLLDIGNLGQSHIYGNYNKLHDKHKYIEIIVFPVRRYKEGLVTLYYQIVCMCQVTMEPVAKFQMEVEEGE